MITVIVAPPPTPNGDLHLGHLSGPYLGVDVLRRFRRLRGQAPLTAVSVDTTQSYVVTSAERLGVTPTELVDRSLRDIRRTLQAANIEFDIVGSPDQDYAHYVKAWFSSLNAAGLFDRKNISMPFDCGRGRFLFESFASGRCPTCLANTKGNICEECGHPNDPRDLGGLHPTGEDANSVIEYREQVGYYFDLEKFRGKLSSFFSGEVGESLRPTHRRLLNELLSKQLQPIPVTFPGTWGLPAPFPGADGLVLNPWVELLPGHYYWVERAFEARGHQKPVISNEGQIEYVQYLGFDNSFYYSVVHVALALAAREKGVPAILPTVLRTNEFYQLGASKFSTSNNSVILGSEFLATEDADSLRFYLCRTNPEMQRTEFRVDEYHRITTRQFVEPWRTIVELVKSSSETAEGTAELAEAAALAARFELAYDSPHASLRLACEVLCAGMAAAIAAAHAGRPFRLLAKVLALGASPIVPRAGENMLRMLSSDPAPMWPNLNLNGQRAAA